MFQRGSNHQPVVEFLFSEMLLAHADHESQQEGVSWCKLNWSNRSILMKDCQCRQACSEQMIRYKFPIFQFQPHFVYSSIMLHHVTSQYISSSIDFQIATRGLWFLILTSPKHGTVQPAFFAQVTIGGREGSRAPDFGIHSGMFSLTCLGSHPLEDISLQVPSVYD
jgi:hypothetical protein